MADLKTTIVDLLNKLEEIQQGQASVFRKQINENFFGKDGNGGVKGAILALKDDTVDIQVSSSEPSDKKTGDLWFKEV